MRFKICFILVLIFFGANLTFAQEPEWLKKMKEIVLLQSTHQDIIRLFGEPIESGNPYSKEFVLKKGKLIVQYSNGFCGEKKRKGWNVPEFTVTEVRFKLKNPVKPDELGINLTGFDSYEVYDVPNAFIYNDDERGIEYFKSRKGKIESITFYPPNKYDYLYCRDSSESK